MIMALSAAGSAAGITDILSMATQLLTWFISSMGSLVNFIFGNSAILFWFLIGVVGSAVGMLMRIWHSA